MSLEHCDALIDKMEVALNEISLVYSEPNETLITVSPSTKIDIKNFLENANSVLDYLSFFIFEEYSKNILDENTFAERADYVSFFYTKSKDNFLRNMNAAFPNLKESNPEIYSIFETHQPWCAPDWRKNLHKLVNQNKHKNLSLQKNSEKYDIKYLNVPGLIKAESTTGLSMTNVYFNGTYYKDISDMKRKLNGNYQYTKIFMFTDLKEPVIEVLSNILKNEKKLIDHFEKIEISTN